MWVILQNVKPEVSKTAKDMKDSKRLWNYFKLEDPGDFPGSPVVKTPPPTVGGASLIPGPRTKIPHTAQHGQKKKKNQIGEA